MYIIYRIIIGVLIKWRYCFFKRDKSIWVFGEWFGDRCVDNCLYLANYIAKEYPDISVYWIATKDADTKLLNKRIQVIKRGSVFAHRILKRASVAVVGQGFIDLDEKGYNYYGNAITLILWHGIPWKRIGHDGSKENSVIYKLYTKIYDYAYGTSYILSPSGEFDKVARTAFGIDNRNIIKAGYPRNSVLYDKHEIERRRKSVLDEIGWTDHTSRVIVYMPTFRNTSRKYDIGKLCSNDFFINYIEKNNIIVIQKAHFVSTNRGEMDYENSNPRFINNNSLDAQSLLCTADLLITDYSGCFFDYSLLDRPIVHYIYDYDVYKNEDRGLYYDKDEVMFGTESRTEQELVDAIILNIENPALEHEKRNKMKTRYLNYEDNNSCQKIAEYLKRKLDNRVLLLNHDQDFV